MDALETLPARVDELASQIVQLRNEMRSEFSAVRTELRAEMTMGFAAVRTELRAEIRTGDEETRRQMRVLHEEVIGRLKLLQEGRASG